jgi:hypothetical protein
VYLRGYEAEATVAAQLLIQAAVVGPLPSFRHCCYCGKNTLPERWYGEDAYQASSPNDSSWAQVWTGGQQRDPDRPWGYDGNTSM